MFVELLIGPNAGTVVDLPQHAAEAELQFGTARLIDANTRIPHIRSKDDTKERVDEDRKTNKSSSNSGGLRNTPSSRRSGHK